MYNHKPSNTQQPSRVPSSRLTDYRSADQSTGYRSVDQRQNTNYRVAYRISSRRLGIEQQTKDRELSSWQSTDYRVRRWRPRCCTNRLFTCRTEYLKRWHFKIQNLKPSSTQQLSSTDHRVSHKAKKSVVLQSYSRVDHCTPSTTRSNEENPKPEVE